MVLGFVCSGFWIWGSGESGVRVAGSWPCRPKGDELAGASEAGTAGDLACMWTVEVGFGFTRLRLIRATIIEGRFWAMLFQVRET